VGAPYGIVGPLGLAGGELGVLLSPAYKIRREELSLYHKYRPQRFEEMQGNEDTVSALRGELKKENHAHAFLFSGPTGCGKTTLGRIVARELGCVGSDFREVDSADFRGIDTIREIRTRSQYAPLEGKILVWLIDEAHKLTGDAQNAFLKALEDAPEHVYYILATTEPHRLIDTIRGRCARYSLNPLSDQDMKRLLRRILHKEGEQGDKEWGEIFDQIIQDSFGYPRNALQILDRVLNVPQESRFEEAKRAAERQSEIIELCRTLVNLGPWKKVANILSSLKEQNKDPEAIRRAILGYCQAVLLSKSDMNVAYLMQAMLKPFYDNGWPQLTFSCYDALTDIQEGER